MNVFAHAPAAISCDPVIVLTLAYSGSERLRSLLSAVPDFECTVGTGLVPLCEQAAATWRRAERQSSSEVSTLAASSIRAMALGMMTIMLARTGKRRWCEFVFTQPASAETFTRLFPGTRIICLYRSCPDLVYSAVHETKWGLSGASFAPFVSAHPVSTVEALTAYWIAHTEQLIFFEETHPDICRGVRYEDLSENLAEEEKSIMDFLSADRHGSSAPWLEALSVIRKPGCGAGLPTGQIPASLLSRADTLMKRLGYPPFDSPDP
jgi:hypothetical protein